jgi:hypothetical protein
MCKVPLPVEWDFRVLRERSEKWKDLLDSLPPEQFEEAYREAREVCKEDYLRASWLA